MTCPSSSSGIVAIPEFSRSFGRLLVGLRSKTSLASGPIRRPLTRFHDRGGYVGAMGELEDLGGLASVGGVVIGDAPNVSVQIFGTREK